MENNPLIDEYNLEFGDITPLELPKFEKKESELINHFDKWLYVFRHLSKLQDRPKALQEKVFSNLFEAAAIANFTKEEKVAYEESLKIYRDIKNIVDTSREEGIVEGIEKGMEKGREQGREQGISERNIQIAKRLIDKGMSDGDIGDITGLTISEIKRLRN